MKFTINRRSLIVCFATALPLVVILMHNFIIYRKGWDSIPETQYSITFWITRLLLVPFVAFYTLKFWIELKQFVMALALHIVGFIIYCILQWALSFVILYYITQIRQINGMRDLFDTIRDNSTVVNLLMYFVAVSFFYLWEYAERNTRADKKLVILEENLAAARSDDLKNHTGTDRNLLLQHITVKNGVRNKIIPVNDIMYFMADGAYIKIAANDHIYLIKRPLYELERGLSQDAFVRIHRSCIVSISFVKEIRSLLNGDYTILLNNGSELRASRTYRSNLQSSFGKI